MENLQKVHAEIPELENQIALIKEEIKSYRESTPDGAERRKNLVKMHMKLGERSRRLKHLRSLI